MDTSDRKPYTPPELKKVTPEQAQLLLLRHASAGDQDAKELLELLYPETPVKT